MVMSSKKVGKMVTADVNKALSNISASTPKPDMKADGAELKAAVAPQKAPTFAEAFRAARKDPEAMKRGSFTWGGKSYTTKMAGEGAKRPAAASAPKVSTPKASAPTTNTRAQLEMRRTATRSQAAIREKRAENQADFRKRMQVGRSGVATAGISASRPKDKVRTGADMLSDFFKRQREREKEIGRQASKPKDYAAERAKMKAQRLAEKAERRKELGIREPGKAKGGSIDGCAIRGKTRAPTRKGK